MTREEAKQMLPIIKAFSEGEDIEYFDTASNIWRKSIDPSFDEGVNSRIKPSPTYRPFANAEECWNEMLKHQPFGWVKDKYCDCLNSIDFINESGTSRNGKGMSYNEVFDSHTFADGSAFGVKVEEN